MEGKGRAKGYIQAGSVCGQKSEFFPVVTVCLCYLAFFTGVVLSQAGIFGFFRREKISR